MLADRPLGDLLAAFASPEPVPGGGSAAALAAALGASLLLMVARLPKTRSGDAGDRSALDAAASSLTTTQAALLAAVDDDTLAYGQVTAAMRLPKENSPAQAARKEAIQRALWAATDVPLNVMRLSVSALEQARLVAAHGRRAAASDVGVGVALLSAAVRGGALNVSVNVASLGSDGDTTAVLAERDRLMERAAVLAGELESSSGSGPL